VLDLALAFTGKGVVSMQTKLTFFPVGNGDMVLIELESGRKILIDMNIRVAADNPEDNTPDVSSQLRKALERDDQGRLYVDALLVSHPDKDHCTGLIKHFHVGGPDDWSKVEDKIFIRELWSSPLVFRRASTTHILCEDAKAFNAEARRRVKRFRESGNSVSTGDRILILGEDENGKTDDLRAILVRIDEQFTQINGQNDDSMTAYLLGPLPKEDNVEAEEKLSKNHSSTIIQFSLSGGGQPDQCRFLTAGDAEVAIWEKLWDRHAANPDCLSYDILQAPHHCSWRSLSYDSWSGKREEAQVCDKARNALSQARTNAIIIASSEPIKDDDNDPPCIRAKREYVNIAEQFKVTMENPKASAPEPLIIEIDEDGPMIVKRNPLGAAAIISRPAPKAG
jgi:hypothetical protein